MTDPVSPRSALRRIVSVWDSLDAVPSDEPAEPHKDRMDEAINAARAVLESAYDEAAKDADYVREMNELAPPKGEAPLHPEHIALRELVEWCHEHFKAWNDMGPTGFYSKAKALDLLRSDYLVPAWSPLNKKQEGEK